jgi:hypothetical protein
LTTFAEAGDLASSDSELRFEMVAEQLDEQSEVVASRIREAQGLLSEAERIFKDETTSEHRRQWPNVYRLESATTHAQEVLALANPRVILEDAVQEVVVAATQARDVIREAVTTGGGSLIGAANELLAATSRIEVGLIPPDLPSLREVREEIERTRTQIKTQISDAEAEVAGQRDQAFAAMNEAADAVDARRKAAEQQAGELGLVTSAIAAENLADAYAIDAKRTEKQAANYTRVSLAVGVLSVVVAIIGLLTVSGENFKTVIAHAAYGLPVAFLAAYVNSLASTHRREGWRLRHIELQIRTANPFLGLLASDRREETLAALALRFFPGQEGVSFDGKGAAEPS